MSTKKRSQGRLPRLLHPPIILVDRYSGLYSGGRIVAYPTPANALPSAISGADHAAKAFWEHVREQNWAVGIGNTRAEAIRDLRRKVKLGYRRPTEYLGDWLPG